MTTQGIQRKGKFRHLNGFAPNQVFTGKELKSMHEAAGDFLKRSNARMESRVKFTPRGK